MILLQTCKETTVWQQLVTKDKINMVKEYNRTLAVEYAKKWALSHNVEFFHFGGVGGDCTNFVSQCLLAGGGVMNYNKYYGWFYIDQANRSPSWASVNYLRRFLLDKNIPGPFAEIEKLNRLQVGDIIQLRQNPFNFNHSLIISKIQDGEIFVCAHSISALDRPLTSYKFEEAIGLHVLGVHL